MSKTLSSGETINLVIIDQLEDKARETGIDPHTGNKPMRVSYAVLEWRGIEFSVDFDFWRRQRTEGETK
jgi:hypothetical protein